jgi:oligopeptide transport system substrate-binding protein
MKLIIQHYPRVVIILVTLLIAGCGGGGAESRVEAGVREGVFHKGNGAEPQALDPHITSGIPERDIITALFEGLVTKNPYTLAIEPAAAESWEISEDGRVYTFKLRQNGRWSNGDEVTAEDFVWSWQRAMTPALGSVYSYMFYPVVNAEEFATGMLDDFSQVGAKALDSHTFQVTLKEPTPYFLQLMEHHISWPVHRKTIESFGAPTSRLTPWARVGNMVNNGPFNLAEWRVNSHVRVEKSETYWDHDNVKLNAIVYYPTENITTEERMFRDGQLHITNDVPVDKIIAYQRDEPELIQVAPYLGTYYYMINTTRPVLDDVRVRQALSMAIDRSLLVETVLQGLVEPAYAIVPPDTLGYYPPQLFSYDPDRARQLLAEAGFPEGRGFPGFEILYNTHEQHQKIAVAIQQMWRQTLGIQVGIVNQEWQVYLATQEELDYDISRRGWIGDYVDPNTFLDMFITDGGNNKTGFSNPRYDQIILREAPAIMDQERRYALFREAETLLIETMPIIPLYTYQSKHLIHPAVRGYPGNLLDWANWKYVHLEASDSP